MTAPDDPTPHLEGTDAIEATVRDALQARATEASTATPDVADLRGAIAADASRRRRRLVGAVGAGIAATLLVGVVLATDMDDDPPERVDTVTSLTTPTTSEVASTTTPATIEEATPSTTTVTTTTPAATTTPTTTTTVSALPDSSTEARAGEGQGPVPALMTDIRVGGNDGFDRVVLEFADGAIPTYSVSYTDPPITEDGRGEAVSVDGAAFLQIRMTGAEAHTFAGEAVVETYVGPKRFSPGTSEVVEVVNTGEFEAIYTWVVGVAHRSPFTVSTLDGPARLVIDIARPS